MAKQNIDVGGEDPRDPKGIGEKPVAPPPTTGFGGEPMPVPPPATPTPPGVSGQMPMPPGKIIAGGLTDKERRELESAGIDTTKPLPGNVAQILAQAQQEARQEATQNLPPPVPPDTPPVEFNPVDIDENDPQAMAEFTRKVREAKRLEDTAKQSETYRQPEQVAEIGQKPPQKPVQAPAATPTIQSALPGKPQPAAPEGPSAAQQMIDKQRAAQEAEAAQAARYAHMDPSVAKAAQIADGVIPPDQSIQVENDLDEAVVAPETTESELGLEAPLTSCPHCGWNLDLDDPVEPDAETKQKFLASVLGRKPYMQMFELFGGQFKVTLRTLATREVDQIYKQAFYESQNQILNTPEDFYERVNRLRVYLQLVRAEGPQGVMADLPDGLTKETNPHAEAHWTGEPQEGQTLLVGIEKYVLDEVLTTESLVRAVGNVCASFNRLVAKMEAMIDNPDFWDATGSSP